MTWINTAWSRIQELFAQQTTRIYYINNNRVDLSAADQRIVNETFQRLSNEMTQIGEVLERAVREAQRNAASQKGK